jgi:N-acyl-L-homoserine lactone synthetase
MTITAEHSHNLSFDPSFYSEMFDEKPEAKYWVGRIAFSGSLPPASVMECYTAMAKLRADVYVDQMGYLGPEQKDTLGRELDDYDSKSIHFGAIENVMCEEESYARVIGSGRLIMKKTEDEPLPIENKYPEIFSGSPIAVGAAEVSRFISRHDSEPVQHMIALAIIRIMSLYSIKNGINADYFEVEKPLLRLLSIIGLPLEQLGNPKQVVEPGGIRTLYPIVVDPNLILPSLAHDLHHKIPLRKFFEKEIPNGGEGFYPSTLIGGYND